MEIKPRSYQLEHLLWHELRDLIQGGYTRVLVPCGALEAHGATGLGTDSIIPEGLAVRIAPEIRALAAPVVPFGVLRTLSRYTGSVSITPSTYATLMLEIGRGLVASGFRELVFLNGHAGNHDGLKEAAYTLHLEDGIHALVYDWYIEPDDDSEEIFAAPGGHSGAGESAMVLAYQPDAAPPGLWKPEEAGSLNPAVSAYPGPYPIILPEEGRGLPEYDLEKANKFSEMVAAKAIESLKKVFARWAEIS